MRDAVSSPSATYGRGRGENPVGPTGAGPFAAVNPSGVDWLLPTIVGGLHLRLLIDWPQAGSYPLSTLLTLCRAPPSSVKQRVLASRAAWCKDMAESRALIQSE